MKPTAALFVVGLLCGTGSAWGQQERPPEPIRAVDLPVSLERIKRRLREVRPTEEATLRLSYYIDVYAKDPGLNLFANYDLHNGPVPFGGPTHADILEVITPREFRSPPVDLTKLLQWLSQKGSKQQD